MDDPQADIKASDLEARRNWTIRLLISGLIILIVSLVGPFATYERFSLGERFLYWGCMIMGALFPGHWTRLFVLSRVKGTELYRDLVAVFVIGLVLAPAIWVANILIIDRGLLHWSFLVEHFAIVWLACLVPVAIRSYYRNERPLPQSDAPVGDHPAAETEVALPPILRHVDPDLHGPIRRVSAHDRQSRVWTIKGEAQVRMRFADALAQLDGAEGMQVHRSHWLAFESIERVTQEGRRYLAMLRCGASVPVSPAYLDDLTAAGIPLSQG